MFVQCDEPLSWTEHKASRSDARQTVRDMLPVLAAQRSVRNVPAHSHAGQSFELFHFLLISSGFGVSALVHAGADDAVIYQLLLI
jgi:hypothetical protein